MRLKIEPTFGWLHIDNELLGYYNSRVWSKAFLPRDFVLHRVEVSILIEQGRLSLNEEGSYGVIEVLYQGANQIKDLDGTSISWIWNVENLQMYYQ